MFDDFARVWTPVALARELGTKPLQKWVANERLALFRDADGRVRALLDRCPHRGVALSLGHVRPDGCLECPFHGWRFDTTGACVHVPMNPEAKRAGLSVPSFPAREVGGLIWVYTAPGEAPSEPVTTVELTSPEYARSFFVKPWSAHWTRAMENMLDVPHLPFVHRRTIGRGLRRRLTDASSMRLDVEETLHGMKIAWTLDGGRADDAFVEFFKPNAMALSLPFGRRRMRLHVFCVPTKGDRTDMIVVGARNFGRYNPLMPLFDRFNRYIVHEDQAVVESSSPAQAPPPALERSVATDHATLRFRKYWLETLKGSRASPSYPQAA